MNKSNNNAATQCALDFADNGTRPAPAMAPATQYETEELPQLGWLTFTDRGEENSYFTLADGSFGFVKIG